VRTKALNLGIKNIFMHCGPLCTTFFSTVANKQPSLTFSVRASHRSFIKPFLRSPKKLEKRIQV
jgi:hypothetical protein